MRLKFEAEPSSNLELVIIKEHKPRNRVDICSEFISRFSNVVCTVYCAPSVLLRFLIIPDMTHMIFIGPSVKREKHTKCRDKEARI